MKILVTLIGSMLTIATFFAVFMLILHINPNEQKIDALSSAITSFEKMLNDNKKTESMPLENVKATEKAIRKFESRRGWQHVGNYIMAIVFGLIASVAVVTIIFIIGQRIMKAKVGVNQ